MSKFYALMGVDPAGFDQDHRYFTSWLIGPLVLAVLRLLLSIYAFVTLFFIIGWNGTHGDSRDNKRSFSYFTTLTYWGLAFYMFFAAAHGFSYVLRGTPWLNRWPRPLQALHSLYYTTVVVFPPLVTIVFWVILFDGSFSSDFKWWSNISQHALNSAYAIHEILLPTTNPPPFLHIAFLILILALYLSLAYLTHATEGFYTYSFLDPGVNGSKSGKVAAYSFGILAAAIVLFLIVWGIIWVRRKVTGGKVKRAKKDAGSENGYGNGYRNGDTEMAGIGK